jgi:hypothetical protein
MANYELFEPGDCNKPFPLNTIEDVFLFSQFVGLTVNLGARGGTQKAVVPRTLVWPNLAKSMAKINPNVTALDIQDGIALIEDWNADDLTEPIALEVPFSDVYELLSKRKVAVNGKLVNINLDESSVQQLLSGEGAVVEMEQKPDRLLSLVRQAPKDPCPVATMLYISNLPAFLSRPSIPSVDGSAIAIKLTTDSIRQLQHNGKTTIRVGKDKITLTLNPDQATSQEYPSIPRNMSLSATMERSASGATSSPYIVDSGGEVIRSTSILDARAEAVMRSAVSSGTVISVPGLLRSAELAFVLPWRQVWKLLGYSRGTLLNTISLAPQEETTIDIFTWDRRKSNIERISTTEVDGSIEQSDTTRDTSDVMNELTRTSDFSRQADGRIGVTYQMVNLNVGGTVSARDALTSVAKHTSNHIHESTSKSATRIKSSRQTKVSESIEVGREERVTRKIKNANMCRVLNLDYFEVLSNYSVTTSFDAERAGLCVLLPNPITISFNRESLRVYERPLRRALLDPMLAEGFAAARFLDARSKACEFACEKCSCSGITDPNSSTGPSWDWATTVMMAVATAVNEIFKSGAEELFQIAVDFLAGPAPGTAWGIPGFNWASLDRFRQWTYGKALQAAVPSLMHELIKVMEKGTSGSKTFGYEDVDRLAYAVGVAGGAAVVSPTKLLIEQIGYIREASYTDYMRSTLAFRYTYNWDQIEAVLDTMGAFVVINDLGLQAALTRLMTWYQVTSNASSSFYSERNADATESLSQATDAVQSTFDLRSTAEAAEREAALLKHLTDNVNYYRLALWNALPLAAQAPYLATLIPPGLVAPRAIGAHGNKLAFPVIPEYHPQIGSYLAEVLRGLQDIEPVTEDVILPTAAVTMESRLGSCDGCEEFIMEHRELDLKQKSADVKAAEERAKQEEIEVQRYKDRLTQDPALLDDPDPNQNQNAVRLIIKQE